MDKSRRVQSELKYSDGDGEREIDLRLVRENDDSDSDDERHHDRKRQKRGVRESEEKYTKIQFLSIRKNFYIEAREISIMTDEEVSIYRWQLQVVKVHGKDVPKPIKTWNQIGLTSDILDMINKLGYERPISIQAQALPIILSGRDFMGVTVAATGITTTLAYVLPMLRHIKDQPPVVTGDGPIAIINTPTPELAQQIHTEISKFAEVLGITSVNVCGGSGFDQQMSDLKRGCEIVVSTPDWMIDVLGPGSPISNLRRVTYLVIDGADDLFEMDYEPQLEQIVENTRPDRQTVIFSATFPRQVEVFAREVLTKPLGVLVG